MHATLQYLKRLPIYDEEKPFRIFTNLPPDAPDQRYSNLDFEKKQVPIHDIRDQLPAPTLDRTGFEVRGWPSSLDVYTLWNKDDVENVYLPELEIMLRKMDPSIHRVFFFDWRLRHSDGPGEDSIDINDLATQLSPAEEVHVDQSPGGVLHRVRLQLPAEADRLLRGRIRVINFWRPLVSPVEKDPLAICDGTTVHPSDLIPCDYVRRRFAGETLFVCYSPAQKWYYLSSHRPEEVLLLKIFDSRQNVPANNCPHASFQLPGQIPNAKPRQSIEVRALVFSE